MLRDVHTYTGLCGGLEQMNGCLLLEVKRELKRIYIDGCLYNERLNVKTEGSKTSPLHWVERVNIQ